MRKVIGKDAGTDVALIKIEAKKKLPAAKLGSSADLQVGEWVAAFGNPFGHGHTITKGIISALGREIDELNRFPFLQTGRQHQSGQFWRTSGEFHGARRWS
jgi:serine protease Do